MKRFTEGNGFTRLSTKRRIQLHYSSPLEEVDNRTRKWKPNKVRENDRYEQLCRNGECTPFEFPSSTYQHFFINKKTTLATLDDLIEYARHVTHYTIDTESQIQPAPRQPSPALLQVEFVNPHRSPVIILVETLHLPPNDSHLFTKIRQLCRTILSASNTIHSWGTLVDELEKFSQFNLFTGNDIQQVQMKNIQEDFKQAFHTKYPFSTYVKTKATENYSLQLAMYVASNQWLDKRMTLSNWGCGIDLSLGTIETTIKFNTSYDEQMGNEKEYRRLMTAYAIHDCLAVTQLVNRIDMWKLTTPPTTVEPEETSGDERAFTNDEQQDLIVELHPMSEDLFEVHTTMEENEYSSRQTYQRNHNDSVINHDERLNEHDGSETVHVSNEPILYQTVQEPIGYGEPMAIQHNEDGDGIRSLPETMNVHLGHHRRRTLIDFTNETSNMTTHVQNESSQVNLFYLDRSERPNLQSTPQQRRNRAFYDRRRAKRYTFEVIRQLYPLFNITKVKRILRSMNIFYVNINIVRHTLFIGVKTQDVANEVEYQLNDRLFTKQHYYRLYPKNK